MRYAINIEQILPQMDFYRRLQAVKAAGFDYAEFGGWPERDVSRMMECCDAAGVGVSCLSGDRQYSLSANEERDAYLEYLRQSLEIACLLEAPYLAIHANGRHGTRLLGGGDSLVRCVASMTRTLERAAALAEEYGKTLVLRAPCGHPAPGDFLTSTADSGDLCRVVGSPHLKVLCDVGQMRRTAGDLTGTLTKEMDVIGYIRLGGAAGAVRETLYDLGYDGFLGLERLPADDAAGPHRERPPR